MSQVSVRLEGDEPTAGHGGRERYGVPTEGGDCHCSAGAAHRGADLAGEPGRRLALGLVGVDNGGQGTAPHNCLPRRKLLYVVTPRHHTAA